MSVLEKTQVSFAYKKCLLELVEFILVIPEEKYILLFYDFQ